jgi:SNF2 family DNA or RNA helicase
LRRAGRLIMAVLETDEAQQIKNRNTKAAKAAVALDARLRWCLTG